MLEALPRDSTKYNFSLWMNMLVSAKYTFFADPATFQ